MQSHWFRQDPPTLFWSQYGGFKLNTNYTSINDSGSRLNCYYCMVAGLLGLRTTELFRITGINEKSGGTVDDIKNLFWHSNYFFGSQFQLGFWQIETYSDMLDTIFPFANSLPEHYGIGIAFERPDRSIGHAFIAAKANNKVHVVDYQDNPATVTDWPPPDDASRVFAFFQYRPLPGRGAA